MTKRFNQSVLSWASISIICCVAGQGMAAQYPSHQRRLDISDMLLVSTTSLISGAFFLYDFLPTETACAQENCRVEELNRWDRRVVGNNHHSARVASDVLSIAVPLGAIGAVALFHKPSFTSKESLRSIATDVFIVLQSASTAYAAAVIVKHGVSRPRPYMYHPLGHHQMKGTRYDTASFYSAHTTVVSAVSFASAFLFSSYPRFKKWRLLAFVAAAGFATTTGLLRVWAGEHFYTDVLVGGATGAVMGVLFPALHQKRARQSTVGVYPVPGGLSVRF